MKGKFCPWNQQKLCQENDCNNCVLFPLSVSFIDWKELHMRSETKYAIEEEVN